MSLPCGSRNITPSGTLSRMLRSRSLLSRSAASVRRRSATWLRSVSVPAFTASSVRRLWPVTVSSKAPSSADAAMPDSASSQFDSRSRPGTIAGSAWTRNCSVRPPQLRLR